MHKKYLTSVIITTFIIGALSGCSDNASKQASSALVSSTVQSEVSKSENRSFIKQEKNNTDVVKEEDNNKGKTNKTEYKKSDSDEQKGDNSSIVEEVNVKEKSDSKDKTILIQKDSSKKSKVIVIDPGHGGKITSEREPISPDSKVMKPKNVGGASGKVTKTPEHVVNLNVALKLKEYLNKAGYTVIMTRTSSLQTIGNVDRALIGNNKNANLVIRIHADSSTNSSVMGASMLVPGNVGYAKNISKISKDYGQTILGTLISEVGMKNRGIVTRTDLTGFNWSEVPVVLIEMGFLSNPNEDKLLSSSSYQNKIAMGLFKGIEKALSN